MLLAGRLDGWLHVCPSPSSSESGAWHDMDVASLVDHDGRKEGGKEGGREGQRE